MRHYPAWPDDRIYIAVTKNVPDRSAEGRSTRTRPVRSDRQTHKHAALLLDRGLSSQTLMLHTSRVTKAISSRSVWVEDKARVHAGSALSLTNLRRSWANYKFIPQTMGFLQIHTPSYIFIPLTKKMGYEFVSCQSLGYEFVSYHFLGYENVR